MFIWFKTLYLQHRVSVILMTMNALKDLVENPPNENAGAFASDGFDFQFDWGLQKLLKLQETCNDYAIVFDYHDDVIVFDREQSPQNVDFIQVKTSRNNNWTKKRLLSRNKEKGQHSILGKLLIHCCKTECTRYLYFVTNDFLANSLIKSGVSSNEYINFCDLKERVQTSIKKALYEEDQSLDIESLKKVYFVVNQLHYNLHSEIVISIISRFIQNNHLSPDLKADSLYMSLYNEIKRRSNYKYKINDIEQLIENKSFTKSRFDSFLYEINKFESFRKTCELIDLKLTMQGVDQYFISNIKKAWNQIHADLMNYGNKEIHELIIYVNRILQHRLIGLGETMLDYCYAIHAIVESDYVNIMGHDEFYFKALILYMINHG